MSYQITIAGRKTSIAWDQGTMRRYLFRLGVIGGEPTAKQLTNPKTVTTAIFKILWCLLPPDIHREFESPEDLFAAVDHETEGPAIYAAVKAIFEDRAGITQKKTSSESDLSLRSSLESQAINGTDFTQGNAPS